MFEYFRDNYAWSLAVMMTLTQGGQLSEVDDACRQLVSMQDEGVSADAAWAVSWLKIAGRVEAQGRADLAAAHSLSAGSKLKRASIYTIMAERMLPVADDRHRSIYQSALDLFDDAVRLSRERVERVTLDTGHGPVPALYIPADGGGPAPAVITVNGLDAFKEFFYFSDLRTEFLARRISLLLVDQPGVGEALRMNGLHHRYDIEVTIGVCVDWLEGRVDVDGSRIGLIGPSLGGYYGVRGAAREPRLACTAIFGAIWDYGENVRRRVEGNGLATTSVPDYLKAISWFFGVDTVEDLLAVTSKFNVRDIIADVTMPMLIVHGEGDRQVPVEEARKVYAAAVNCRDLELRIFTREEGGSEHCGIDNYTLQVQYIADWMTDRLGVGPRLRQATRSGKS